MKTLEEIMNETSLDLFNQKYLGMFESTNRFARDVAIRYAQQACENLRERIAEEACLEPNGMLLQVDKQSILEVEIILP